MNGILKSIDKQIKEMPSEDKDYCQKVQKKIDNKLYIFLNIIDFNFCPHCKNNIIIKNIKEVLPNCKEIKNLFVDFYFDDVDENYLLNYKCSCYAEKELYKWNKK